MIGWYLLIGALAVFGALLLFGFVGCKFDPKGPGSGPTLGPFPTPDIADDYPSAVLSEGPDLVAYWRLGDPDTTPVPSSGGAATDEAGEFPGDYFSLEAVENSDNLRHSPATTGNISLEVTPGLLQIEPQDESPCIEVEGGFVQVPFDDQLNPPQFTFEAWVSPEPDLEPEFFYCLAESTGPPGLDQKKTGWGLYLGPEDPDNPSGTLLWQVWMGDGEQFNRVAIAKPDFPVDSPEGNAISPLRSTYLALTFDGVQKVRLWLYYPDSQQKLEFNNLQALKDPDSSVNFVRNDPSTDGQGDFFIGTGSNLFPNGGSPSQRLYPFKGKIQEVALYSRDLSDPDNNDIGVQTTLAGHFFSGGNV